MKIAALAPARTSHHPVDPRRERLRRRLGFAALVACLPYLTLKALWVLGVDVGVEDPARVSGGGWVLVNLLTFLMDATAALIAYLLTRPGGPRVRTWLLALPMWMASGLLSVIMIAVPLDLSRALFGAPNPFRDRDGFLEPWVYAVVYGGFIVEGAVLLGAFAMFVSDRHGGVLRSPVAWLARQAPSSARAAALVAAALLPIVAMVHLAWAGGSRFGLSAARIADMDASTRIMQGVLGVLALGAAAGLVVLASGRLFGRGRRGRVWLPLAAAWVGSAAVFGWGGFIGDAGMIARDPQHPSSGFMIAVYIAETVVGLLVLAAGLRALPAAGSGDRDATPAGAAAATTVTTKDVTL